MGYTRVYGDIADENQMFGKTISNDAIDQHNFRQRSFRGNLYVPVSRKRFRRSLKFRTYGTMI